VRSIHTPGSASGAGSSRVEPALGLTAAGQHARLPEHAQVVS
jgi:hypothetical protein